jgi:hypothetical protein
MVAASNDGIEVPSKSAMSVNCEAAVNTAVERSACLQRGDRECAIGYPKRYATLSRWEISGGGTAGAEEGIVASGVADMVANLGSFDIHNGIPQIRRW